MLSFFLRSKIKKVKGVNATLYLKVGLFRDTLTFGRGNPASPDHIEFNSLRSLIKGKPDRATGDGHAILAFKEALGG